MSKNLPDKPVHRQLEALAWNFKENGIDTDLVVILIELKRTTEDVAQNNPQEGLVKVGWFPEMDGEERALVNWAEAVPELLWIIVSSYQVNETWGTRDHHEETSNNSMLQDVRADSPPHWALCSLPSCP